MSTLERAIAIAAAAHAGQVDKAGAPYIDHPAVPRARYLSELDKVPEDLSNYVLKPLFSFAGSGVKVDVTDADYHSLEAGLRSAAQDTGGLYVKTNDFPEAALRRVRAALSGHYVLTFDPPPGRRGSHSFRLTLPGRRGTVISRTGYAD